MVTFTMELKGKERRQIRRRNHFAKDLRSPLFHQKVKGDKRSHLIDELHEQEAEEDLHEYFGLGKAPKE